MTPPQRFTPDELDAVKARNPVADVAGQWVRLRRRHGGKYIGPCPICSTTDKRSATRFECDADKWVCAVCPDGGDVIALMMKREGIDFATAVERLGGVREESITPALAERRGRADHGKGLALDAVPPGIPADMADAWRRGWQAEARKASGALFYRERERKRLHAMWQDGVPLPATPDNRPRRPATPAEAYLLARGLMIPPDAKLRFHPFMPLFADGREAEPRLVHRGPAMLAAIRGPDGIFAGLHITWLDPQGPKGKAHVIDPDTGEVLPSKKVRGSKAGGYIDLGSFGADLADSSVAHRMIAGEGIETVLAVYTALIRSDRMRVGDIFRSAVDLGNLGGRALETVRHPTLQDAAGRARRVPGPDPDPASPAMGVPDNVTELVLLGDGDSDPFTTQAAMTRAARRHARPGRVVRVVWPAPGMDFNDMLRPRAAPMSDLPDE